MNKYLFFRIAACIFAFSLCLYFYVDKQNELTSFKIRVPKVTKEIEVTKEESQQLQYEIDRFESPLSLMEFTKLPEFSHLKHPFLRDVLKVAEGIALQEKKIENNKIEKRKYLLPMAVR